MIYPDYAFGYDHRDYLPPALEKAGAEVVAKIAIPPTESSFTRYFPQIPSSTEVLYHVMVGPAVLTFVKELGEFYGSSGPKLFGFIDSLEAVDINSPGLEYLDGSHFWEGSPRYAQASDSDAMKAYRAAVGIDDNGASVNDPRDISTAGHMFGCWETLYVIKQAMEASGYRGPEDRAKLVEATEAISTIAEGPEHPQGDKVFDGKIHQVFGHQYISKLEGGRLNVVHKTSIEDSRYEPEADYTAQPF
jgi:branched-chain amino acid transport system substrate-binding protein